MMGHPVNPVDLDLAEVASFYCEDLLEELRLRIHVIVIVVAAQDLVALQYVLDVHGQNRGALSYLFNRELLVLILEQKVEHAIGPVADVGAMTEVTEWFLGGALLVLDQRKLVAEVDQELTIAKPLPGRQYHDA